MPAMGKGIGTRFLLKFTRRAEEPEGIHTRSSGLRVKFPETLSLSRKFL